VPKHVVVPYVEITLYSTNKYIVVLDEYTHSTSVISWNTTGMTN